jgi:DNA-binding transcriptional ArsR family regulator
MIGNAKRLAIMAQLLNDELTVGTLAKRVELSQSALSHPREIPESLRLRTCRRAIHTP